MNVTYQLHGTIFEWDENKAQLNIEKHAVTFEEAAEIFSDPFYQSGDASVAEEERDFFIGYTFSQRLLLVVSVERHKRIRIISARIATRTERKLYETA